MKEVNLKISGMHCASCAHTIEKKLAKISGVQKIAVNYGTEKAKIIFDPDKTGLEFLSTQIKPLGYDFILDKQVDAQASDKQLEILSMKRQVFSALPIAIFSILLMTWEFLAQLAILPMMTKNTSVFFHHLMPIFATYILFSIGKPYLLGVYRFLRFGKANMDTLIGLGTMAAFLYSFIISAFEVALANYLNVEQSYYDVTIVVLTFIALGKYLEAKSKLKTGDAIEELLNLQAKTALVVRAGKEIEITIDQVAQGEIIIIKPGAKIPVDGVIQDGSSYVDESMVTGEPMPVKKSSGDLVLAGTINTSGHFSFQASKVGAATMLGQIIKMVEEAQGTKAPIQALADKISAVFVPIVLVLAFVTLGIWLSVGVNYFGFAQSLSYGLVSFVSILVIACPCALGLATPTAIIVGVGKGAQAGILVKDAATLEKLHQVNTVVLDKTGTLTRGKPELVDLKNFCTQSDNDLLAILASLENKSEHPLAQAILNNAKAKNLQLQAVQNFEAIKGQGLKGEIQNQEYFAGNLKLIQDLKLTLDKEFIEAETLHGKTPIILATKEKVLAIFMVADSVKSEAVEAIKDLHKLNIKVVMLTGDNKNTAQFIAKLLNIDEVVAEVLPQDKLAKIKTLQAEGKIVAMAGDGVNDAPALAQADVGIAMATGTDVAIASAGITLLQGDISKLVKAIRLSKLTMRGIKQNLFWAFIYNIIGIPLASGIFFPFFGWLLSPVFAGLAMALSSVSVVSNSLRLKLKKL
jgi:Cu+-exporting ATPase